MNLKYLFFDLDGTLINSEMGVTRSVVYALDKFGIKENDRATLLKFLGPPLTYSFKTFYGFSDGDADKAVAYYRERYRDIGIHENEVYDGIAELLASLKEQGKKLFVATSKPEHFAKQILAEVGLDRYFDGIYGSTFDESRSTKDKVLAYALSEAKADKSASLMIGDRYHDVEGAEKNGIDCVGVLFGFGNREELIGAGAVAVADTAYELEKILLKS